MGLALGNTDVNKIYVGDVEITKIYCGTQEVYSSTLPYTGGTFISATTGNSTTNVTVHPLNIPTANSGDMLLVFTSFDGSPTVTCSNSCWTELFNTPITNNVRLLSHYKIADTINDSLTLCTSNIEQNAHIAYRLCNINYICASTGYCSAYCCAPHPVPPVNLSSEKSYMFFTVTSQGNCFCYMNANQAPSDYTNKYLSSSLQSTGGVSLGVAEKCLNTNTIEQPSTWWFGRDYYVAHTIATSTN